MNHLEEDIKRYLNGTMTPAERHAIEKRALADPFLADALEGAESFPVHEITTDVEQLKQKISKPKNRWTVPIRLAAACIGIALIATITILNLRDDEPALTAEKKPTPQQTDYDTAKIAMLDTIDEKPKTIVTQTQVDVATTLKESKQTEPTTAKAKSTKTLPEHSQNNLAKADSSTKESNTLTAALTSTSIRMDSTAIAMHDVTMAEAARVAHGLDVTPIQPSREPTLEKTELEESKLLGEHINQVTVTGQVRDASGSPMPGVNVITKGSTTGSVTDADGKYAIVLPAHTGILEFSFIGYVTQEMKVDKATAYADVQLMEDATQLSEVVVTGYGEKKTDSEPIVRLAEPVGGRKAYDQYLEDKKIYPQQALENKVEGKVVIEFSISATGALSDFEVIRKLGFGCDEEVIRLVKEGPAWRPSYIDNEPVESLVRVKTRFSMAKKK